MMLHCTNCKKKFFESNVDSELEGKVVECKYCNQKLLYESRTKYLDNRLIELNKDLDYTESKINLRNSKPLFCGSIREVPDFSKSIFGTAG